MRMTVDGSNDYEKDDGRVDNVALAQRRGK